MTIEEKAKAYDEALNWMRELYPELQGAAKEDAEHFFPELAESEDEKIRKHIVEILQNLPGCYWYGQKEKDDSLSYLERQKKQKDYRKLYEDVAQSEWFKENYAGKSLGEEQKPEWSEADEVYLEDALWCVDKAEKSCKDDEDKGACWSAKRWLKSLSGRLNLQPKNEWSEEDEKKINFLSRLIEFQVKDDEYCFGDGRLISKQEAIEMLKSLRPQPRQEWDEFDEDCLKRAIWYVENPAPSVVKDTNLALWLKSLPTKIK